MEIEEYKNGIKIYPFDNDKFNNIDVYKPMDDVIMKRGAEVNWSAIGSCSPEIARQYAKGILKAADIAEGLNKGGK